MAPPNSQRSIDSKGVRLAPMEKGAIRVSCKLGARSVDRVVAVRNEILDIISGESTCLELRSPQSYALTIMGEYLVRSQLRNRSELDCHALAHDLRKKMPKSINHPLKRVDTVGVVWLGRGRNKTLAISLDSGTVSREAEAARRIFRRHTGSDSIVHDTPYVPHISIARIKLAEGVPEIEPTLLPRSVFLERLDIK